MICEANKLKAKTKDNTGNLQNMSVSGSVNCTFLKIYWAGKHQKGAISGPGNLQKSREILYHHNFSDIFWTENIQKKYKEEKQEKFTFLN